MSCVVFLRFCDVCLNRVFLFLFLSFVFRLLDFFLMSRRFVECWQKMACALLSGFLHLKGRGIHAPTPTPTRTLKRFKRDRETIPGPGLSNDTLERSKGAVAPLLLEDFTHEKDGSSWHLSGCKKKSSRCDARARRRRR